MTVGRGRKGAARTRRGVSAASPPPVDGDSNESSEKLQKVLARLGLGSRREIERWIEAGRISVNGARARTGARVGADDAIALDGKRVSRPRSERPRVLIYNKPGAEICTRADPEGRPTVYDNLPPLARQRWISVGRLDVNTQGLLLFTTLGVLAHRLTHPSYEVEREYAVRVLGEVPPAALDALTAGIDLDGTPARFKSVQAAGGEGVNHWYRVVLEEGRNREVHRMWASQGIQVSRLIRVRYGPITLPRDLRAGRSRDASQAELTTLLTLVGLDPPAPAPSGSGPGPGRQGRGRQQRPRPRS